MAWILLLVYLLGGAIALVVDNCLLCKKCKEEYVLRAVRYTQSLSTGKNTIAYIAMPILFLLWPLAMLMIRARLNKIIAEEVIMAEEGAG